MVTQEELKKLFHYSEDSGVFTRIKITANCVKIGDIAGTRSSTGYIKIRFGKKHYLAHRLAWLYVYGELPEFIDHINHVRYDNRIENLRPATIKINGKNRSMNKNNKSGATGVRWHKGRNRWISQIKVDSRQVHLGSFTEYHEAVNARKNAEVLYGFHKNHGT